MNEKSSAAGLAFERHGTGVPLVFIHAFPLNRLMWEPQSAQLSKNFQVITPDLPGFGGSPLKNSTTSMVEMAQSILGLLDELRITDKCVFIGLSMGGYALFQLLKLAPERIRALVFASTRAAADSPEGRAKRFKTIETIEKQGIAPLPDLMRASLLGKTALENQPPLISHVDSLIKDENPAGVCAALRGMAERPDSTDLLSQIKVPALFISGLEDPIIPTAEMEKMALQTPKGSFEKVAEAGHLLNMESPKVFNDHILQFLKRRVL